MRSCNKQNKQESYPKSKQKQYKLTWRPKLEKLWLN